MDKLLSQPELPKLAFPHQTHAFARFQAKYVDIIKSSAIRLLHKTTQGEVLLLKIYAWGEEATELSLPCPIDELCQGQPEWIKPQLERHLSDESRHSRILHTRIAELLPDYQPKPVTKVDYFSQKKLDAMKALDTKWSPRFRAGSLVTMYAVAWCGERMVERVLNRHLAQLPEQHPTTLLLQTILADERQHVALCEKTLQRLVDIDEIDHLNPLLTEVIDIERRYSILGALGLWAAGALFLVRQRLLKKQS